jgi:DNA polymerase sigma|tara:strand:- start:2413 stop:2583 length:171 start_codon:yes stop_codon:yes gene_type:complete
MKKARKEIKEHIKFLKDVRDDMKYQPSNVEERKIVIQEIQTLWWVLKLLRESEVVL